MVTRVRSLVTTALTIAIVAGAMLPESVVAKNNVSKCHQQPVVSTEPRSNGHKTVKAKVLIQAAPHVVWEAVHEERKHDPDLAYSKVLDQKQNVLTLEQKFDLIPVIGSAVCVMKSVETHLQRIDYSMVRSDRFKAFEGSWVLTPGEDPNTTYLELSSYLDMGLPIPRPLVENATAKKLQRRLTNVKKVAEAAHSRVAQAGKAP